MTDGEDQKDALVVVPDDQLSLAIGREGQNVRLAHRLTGWKIDIKSVSQMEAEEAGADVKGSSQNYEYDEQEERAVDSDEIQEEIEEEMNQQEYDEEDLVQETESEDAEETEEE